MIKTFKFAGGKCEIYFVVMIGQVGLGLLLALMFRFCWNVVRLLCVHCGVFPVVLPTVAVGRLFAKIYEIQPNYGLLNSFLDAVGLSNLVQPWIGQESTAPGIMRRLDIWVAMGFYSVIFYGALLDIPEDILEAARIDGAEVSDVQEHLLPLLRPMIITSLVFSFQEL